MNHPGHMTRSDASAAGSGAPSSEENLKDENHFLTPEPCSETLAGSPRSRANQEPTQNSGLVAEAAAAEALAEVKSST